MRRAKKLLGSREDLPLHWYARWTAPNRAAKRFASDLNLFLQVVCSQHVSALAALPKLSALSNSKVIAAHFPIKD